MVYKKSHQRCSIKKGVLGNFAKFTGKHLFYRTPLDDCFLVYKAKENNLQTTLYRKSIDQPSYLHTISEHPSAIKIVLHTAKRQD